MSSGRIKKLTRKVLKDRQKAWVKTRGERKRMAVLAFDLWPEDWKKHMLSAKTIGAYMPLSDELDFSLVLEYLASKGKTICFPRVNGEEMDFYEALPSDCKEKGSFGIYEPSSSARIVEPSRIDLLIVPGAAYAADGTRLGRGKGFYDRYCAENGKNQSDAFCGKILGTVPERFMFRSLPGDEWDLRADAIVTEEHWYDVTK